MANPHLLAFGQKRQTGPRAAPSGRIGQGVSLLGAERVFRCYLAQQGAESPLSQRRPSGLRFW